MNFSDCLAFEKTKGMYVIQVNSPKDNNYPVNLTFSALDLSMKIELMVNSVYIGHTDKQILVSAYYAMNSNSKSDYIKIDPDKFTKIEVDYDYYIHQDEHCVKKVILKSDEC